MTYNTSPFIIQVMAHVYLYRQNQFLRRVPQTPQMPQSPALTYWLPWHISLQQRQCPGAFCRSSTCAQALHVELRRSLDREQMEQSIVRGRAGGAGVGGHGLVETWDDWISVVVALDVVEPSGFWPSCDIVLDDGAEGGGEPRYCGIS